MNFRIIHSFGFDKYINAIKTLIGKDPFEMDFPFSDLTEEKQKDFQSRKLYHFPDGIYDVSNGRINKTVCKTIETILGISKVYAISFCIDDKYFGGSTLFIPKSTISSGELKKEYVLAIESLASQASFAINKLRDFEAITKKENELELAQSKFNQLVNQLNDIVWIAKGDGTELIDVNNSFETYFGYPSSEFAKNPNLWLEIVHPEDKEIALKSSKELSSSGNAECEYRIIRGDGTTLWIHERKSIVYNAKGEAVQMGGVATDITDKKLLEDQLRLKDYALEHSPNATIFTDLDGYITYNNNGFLNLFGYKDKTEVLNKHISEFASSGDYKESSLDSLRKGEVYIEEIKPKRKDGSIFHCIGIASPVIHEEKILCIMAVFIDITQLKLMEVNLKESEAKLLQQNDEKDKFFTIIAHDLQSPFSGLLGLLNLLHDNYINFGDEQRIKILQASLDSAQKIFTLLLDLLEWASLQNNQAEIKKEKVLIDQIIKDNINLYLNDTQIKGISIENNIQVSTQLNIDLNSINTVIRNILINAIKFTPSGGCIAFGMEQMTNAIEISIKDTGIGMSEDTIAKLFTLDKNTSMPGTNNETGTGLGLSICNRIVKSNNWKIKVESEIGKGSTFRLLIPTN